jgi:hypothetical protein
VLQGLKNPAKPTLLAKEIRELSQENRTRFLKALKDTEDTEERLELLKANHVLKGLKYPVERRMEILSNFDFPDTKDFKKRMNQMDETIVLELESIVESLDMDELQEIIDDPKKGYVDPDWQQIENPPKDAARKDIF